MWHCATNEWINQQQSSLLSLFTFAKWYYFTFILVLNLVTKYIHKTHASCSEILSVFPSGTWLLLWKRCMKRVRHRQDSDKVRVYQRNGIINIHFFWTFLKSARVSPVSVVRRKSCQWNTFFVPVLAYLAPNQMRFKFRRLKTIKI